MLRRFGPTLTVPDRRAGPMFPHRGRALLAAASPFLLSLGACSSEDVPAVSVADSADTSGYVSVGKFSCHPGKAWQAVQIAASADVPPGGSVPLSVDAPPALPTWMTPDKIILRCEADGNWCGGASCNGNPPVDFLDKNENGLTWKSARQDNGQTKTTFTAIAHNSDSKPHHVTLTIDMPAP